MLTETDEVGRDHDHSPPHQQGKEGNITSLQTESGTDKVISLHVKKDALPSQLALSAEERFRNENHLVVFLGEGEYTQAELTDESYQPGTIVLDGEKLEIIFQENVETYHSDKTGSTYSRDTLVLGGLKGQYGIEYSDGVYPDVTIVFAETLQFPHRETAGREFKYRHPTLEERAFYDTQPHPGLQSVFASIEKAKQGSGEPETSAAAD